MLSFCRPDLEARSSWWLPEVGEGGRREDEATANGRGATAVPPCVCKRERGDVEEWRRRRAEGSISPLSLCARERRPEDEKIREEEKDIRMSEGKTESKHIRSPIRSTERRYSLPLPCCLARFVGCLFFKKKYGAYNMVFLINRHL